MKCNSFSLEGEKQLRKVFFLDRSAIGLDWIEVSMCNSFSAEREKHFRYVLSFRDAGH